MTPKEKAQELLEKMSSRTYQYQEYAGARYTECEVGYQAGKKCALIAVDEILNDDWYIATREDLIARKEYWNEVKQEIEKL